MNWIAAGRLMLEPAEQGTGPKAGRTGVVGLSAHFASSWSLKSHRDFGTLSQGFDEGWAEKT